MFIDILGGKTAELSLSRTTTSIRLVVRDEGCGMPEDVVNSIRGGVPRVGVGIAGMRERVRQFEGTLEITSSHAGTSLIIEVPLGGLTTTPLQQATEQLET